jgi:hypothetical protein
LLKRRIVSANHAAMVLEYKCRLNVRIPSREGGKLVGMVCEPYTLNVGFVAGLLSLTMCGKSRSVLHK